MPRCARSTSRTRPDIYEDIAKRTTCRAVSIVKPGGPRMAIRPLRSCDLFEGFMKNIVNAAAGSTRALGEHRVFVTFDEGGGYYDSGYIQPVDFFGDGTAYSAADRLSVLAPAVRSTTPTATTFRSSSSSSGTGACSPMTAPQPRQPAKPESVEDQSRMCRQQPGHRRSV